MGMPMHSPLLFQRNAGCARSRGTKDIQADDRDELVICTGPASQRRLEPANPDYPPDRLEDNEHVHFE